MKFSLLQLGGCEQLLDYSLAKSQHNHKNVLHFGIELVAALVQHAQKFNAFQIFRMLFVQFLHGFHRL